MSDQSTPWRFPRFSQELDLYRIGEPYPDRERVSLVDAHQAKALLRRFGDGGRHQHLRTILRECQPGREVARLSDSEVIDELAIRLMRGTLVATISTKSAPLGDIEPGPVLVSWPQTKKAEQLTWIEIHLEDTDGHPVPNERFLLELPDGTHYEGRLDERGRARVEQIPKGKCKTTFPDLDETEWHPA